MDRMTPKLNARRLSIPAFVLAGAVLGFVGGRYAEELWPKNSAQPTASAQRIEDTARTAASELQKLVPGSKAKAPNSQQALEWAPPAEIASRAGMTEHRSAAKKPVVWQPPAEIAHMVKAGNAPVQQ